MLHLLMMRYSLLQGLHSQHEHLTAFFDSMDHKKQDAKNSMTKLYAMQLRDANKTIETLCDKVTRLRNINQSKVTTLQEKVTESKIENQALKSKVYLLQMRLEIYLARMKFASQVAPFGALGTSLATHPTGLGKMDPSLN
ncbi:hypothetical protein VP01_2847g3 [Puccinia sorghi]|uniref:Uncharacterized protein n=1 Tax=Puccinia sorghi TaxID=27349 RepID=A0A0L6V2U8_9BASI|nr:hypothetical protein VP01_2847g3 [Puccinia sorghi]